MQVTLGEHNRWDSGEKLEKKVRVATIFIHESYNRRTVSNDIAVLELAEEVDLNTYTPPPPAWLRCVHTCTPGHSKILAVAT